MQEQIIFENGNLTFKNTDLTLYSTKLLTTILELLKHK